MEEQYAEFEEVVVPVGIASEKAGQEVALSEQPQAEIVPLLGLVVNMGNPSEVAKALAAVRQAKATLDDARRGLENVLLEESRRQGTKTLHLDGSTAKISGGPQLQWDIEELQKLEELGVPEERMKALITTEVSYKVNASVAKQLEGANPEYAKVVSAARKRIEKAYRVEVD